MARGMCVIASDEGGMHDVLHHDSNGYVVPVGEVDGIVSLSEAVISDVERFRRISRAARETAEQLSWDRVAIESVAFYERLLRSKARGAAVRVAAEVSTGVGT
jgi:glycosyltransferase involved in cell wall biosynthesis